VLFWVIPVVVVLAAVAWVGVRGLLAKGELEQAQTLVSELRAEASGLEFEALGPTYDTLVGRAATARALTSDPVWRVLEFVPFLGRNLTVTRELAAVTDDTVSAVGPLVGLAATLDSEALAPVNGAIPLGPIQEAVPLVHDATQRLTALEATTRTLDVSFAVGPVVAARDRLAGLLGGVVPELQTADTLVPLLPPMLGSEGPRSYVVMFQNNAEARSLGGTALSFALISIDAGKISLVDTVPAGFDNFPSLNDSIIPVPDGFEQIYPTGFGRFIANATLRPSYPSAASIVFENWRVARGITPDGVISVDAVGLSYILRATGPISLSTGDVLDSDSVVRILLNEVLQRVNTGDLRADNAAQDLVYSEAVSQTFGRLSSGQFDVPALLASVMQGFSEHRFAYWSSDPAQQTAVADAALADDLPQSTDTTDAVGIYLNDYVGAKLNYYLRTAVTTSAGACGADGLWVHRVSMQLSSILPPESVPGLSPSILGEYKREKLAPGVQRLMLFVYAPPGSTILGASVDGVPVTLVPLHDTDYPVARVIVTVPPGAATVMTVDLQMDHADERALDLQVTPLIATPVRSVADLGCDTVPAPAG
jgi:hypothetical protein